MRYSGQTVDSTKTYKFQHLWFNLNKTLVRNFRIWVGFIIYIIIIYLSKQYTNDNEKLRTTHSH